MNKREPLQYASPATDRSPTGPGAAPPDGPYPVLSVVSLVGVIASILAVATSGDREYLFVVGVMMVGAHLAGWVCVVQLRHRPGARGEGVATVVIVVSMFLFPPLLIVVYFVLR